MIYLTAVLLHLLEAPSANLHKLLMKAPSIPARPLHEPVVVLRQLGH